MLDLARRLKDSVEPPLQSGFRVSAVCTFRHGGRLRAVAGVNSEPCSLCGAICAERSALVQLRLFKQPPVVECVYLTSDASEPITPGMLCREYMSDCFCSPDTAVVSAGAADGAPALRTTLGELFPSPPLLRGVPRAQLAATAERLGEQGAAGAAAFFACAGAAGPGLSRLFSRLLLLATSDQGSAVRPAPAARTPDEQSGVAPDSLATHACMPPSPLMSAEALHPIKLAAGALLSDGAGGFEEALVATQHQAPEHARPLSFATSTFRPLDSRWGRSPGCAPPTLGAPPFPGARVRLQPRPCRLARPRAAPPAPRRRCSRGGLPDDGRPVRHAPPAQRCGTRRPGRDRLGGAEGAAPRR